jgi:hypothetical protein
MKIYLDDIRNPPASLPGRWTVVRRVWIMKLILWLSSRTFSFVTHVSLDHDLGEQPTGYDLCKWMAAHKAWPSKNVYVHSMNPVGANNMASVINRYFISNKV